MPAEKQNAVTVKIEVVKSTVKFNVIKVSRLFRNRFRPSNSVRFTVRSRNGRRSAVLEFRTVRAPDVTVSTYNERQVSRIRVPSPGIPGEPEEATISTMSNETAAELATDLADCVAQLNMQWQHYDHGKSSIRAN